MKLKTRLLAPLFAVLMLGTATSAYADLTCAISTTPVARIVLNGHWENTGDLTFTCTAPNATPTTDASITIYYGGLTITNSPTIPADHNISIAPGASYGVTLDTTRADTGATGVSNANSLVAVMLPAQPVPAAGSFTVRNVLLSAAGALTSGAAVSANVNVLSQSGNVTLTGSPIVIINSALPMLNSTTNPPALQPIGVFPGAPAQFTSAGGITPADILCSTQACRDAKASFSLSVSEDHIDSWRVNTQYYNNGNGVTINGTNVLFTASGMLPGSIISNCVLTQPAGTVWALTGSGIAGANGTTTWVAELIGGATNMTAIETLIISCGTSTTNPAYLPGGSTGNATTPITISVTAFPNGNALPGMGGTPSLAGGTPRYATGSAVGPVTVVQFGASAAGQTTMLIPYAVANVGSYDTGIAIANTTKDPVFGTDAQGAAPDSSGSITFHFFPGDGSASYTITPTSGFNMTGGQVPSGNSFIGTLSSILQSGSRTAPFQGYIIAIANFTHAHGVAYVYGGGATDRLTSATPVHVIPNPLGQGRGALLGTLAGVEATTH